MTKDSIKKKLPELLYFIPLAVIVFISALNTTMFRVYFRSSFMLVVPVSLAIVLKVIIYDRKPELRFLLLLAVIAVSFIVYDNSMYIYPYMAAVITAGAVNIPFKKILKWQTAVVFFTFAAAVAASLLGIVENLQYVTERGVRNSFGMVYTTAFAAHIFFMMASCAVLLDRKLTYAHCAAGAAVSVIVYILCKARTDCFCMLLLCAGLAVIIFFRDGKGGALCAKIKSVMRFLCIWSMPLAAAAMTVITVLYNPSYALWRKLDSFLTTRLRLGNEGFKKYPVTLLGQYIELIGNGESTELRDNYFYLDCSYIHCLLIFGAVFTVLIIAAHVIAAMRYKNNGYMLWVIAMLSLNCVTAHHLPDCAYTVFYAALFAEGGIPLREIFRKKTPDGGAEKA